MLIHRPADGAAIRHWRRKRGLKTGEFATAVRISPSHLRNVENGKRPASIELLNRIAERLGLDVEQLQLNHLIEQRHSEVGTA